MLRSLVRVRPVACRIVARPMVAHRRVACATTARRLFSADVKATPVVAKEAPETKEPTPVAAAAAPATDAAPAAAAAAAPSDAAAAAAATDATAAGAADAEAASAAPREDAVDEEEERENEEMVQFDAELAGLYADAAAEAKAADEAEDATDASESEGVTVSLNDDGKLVDADGNLIPVDAAGNPIDADGNPLELVEEDSDDSSLEASGSGSGSGSGTEVDGTDADGSDRDVLGSGDEKEPQHMQQMRGQDQDQRSGEEEDPDQDEQWPDRSEDDYSDDPHVRERQQTAPPPAAEAEVEEKPVKKGPLDRMSYHNYAMTATEVLEQSNKREEHDFVVAPGAEPGKQVRAAIGYKVFNTRFVNNFAPEQDHSIKMLHWHRLEAVRQVLRKYKKDEKYKHLYTHRPVRVDFAPPTAKDKLNYRYEPTEKDAWIAQHLSSMQRDLARAPRQWPTGKQIDFLELSKKKLYKLFNATALEKFAHMRPLPPDALELRQHKPKDKRAAWDARPM